MYVNFIILLCKLTVDFVGVWRYNKDTIRQEHKTRRKKQWNGASLKQMLDIMHNMAAM